MRKYNRLVLILVIFFISNSWAWSGNLKIHFIDVREGDAILVKYEGKNYLIDSGRNFLSFLFDSWRIGNASS